MCVWSCMHLCQCVHVYIHINNYLLEIGNKKFISITYTVRSWKGLYLEHQNSPPSLTCRFSAGVGKSKVISDSSAVATEPNSIPNLQTWGKSLLCERDGSVYTQPSWVRVVSHRVSGDFPREVWRVALTEWGRPEVRWTRAGIWMYPWENYLWSL